MLHIPVVKVATSPERKCNIHVYDTVLQPIYPKNINLMSLVLMHAGYLNETAYSGMPGSFDSSQMLACVMGIGSFDLGL